jgi:hypothetical protein
MAFTSLAAASVAACQCASGRHEFRRKMRCGTGANGTDDTAAFNLAASAANKAYVASGAPSSLLLVTGRSCLIAGTVTLGSGVVVEGPGALVVPSTQAGPVLQFVNADQVGRGECRHQHPEYDQAQ